jgi:Uma2 family endonuclease
MSVMTPTQLLELPGISEWIPSRLYRMTLEQYETLVESGAFTEHDRFHLINGLLVEKTTQNDPHATADELCGRALEKAIAPGRHVRSAKPVRLPPNSKPEPDRSVVRGTIRDYSSRSPGPEDIGLILEVSVRSLCTRSSKEVRGAGEVREVEGCWRPVGMPRDHGVEGGRFEPMIGLQVQCPPCQGPALHTLI